MNKNQSSTRRMFLKRGAMLAAPVAAASSVSVAAMTKDRSDDGLNARIARLENEAAIRKLHSSWLRQVNAAGGHPLLDSTVRRLGVHDAGAADRIEVAEDGRSAKGEFDCAVELESPLPLDSTLAQMAHAQGTGTVRVTQRRTLKVEYTKVADTWSISSAVLELAS
jgi:hypothetical protein